MHFRVEVEDDIGERNENLANEKRNCDEILASISPYDVLDITLLANTSQYTPLYLHTSPLNDLCHKEEVKYHTDFR
jgi:hypothetical protein